MAKKKTNVETDKTEIDNTVTPCFGAYFSPTDVRDYRLAKPAMAVEYPEEFEIKMAGIKNQGSVGSCVAHSCAEVVEYFNKEQEKKEKLMSVGFIYGNRRNSLNKSSGMYVREALSNMCKFGTCYYEDFPYNKEVPTMINLFEENFDKLKDKAYPNRFSTYFRLYTDNDIKQALMNYGPVIFAMNWYSDIKVDGKGIISTNENRKDIEGGHCMVIYGWNKDGWKIMNSWGTFWGKSGTAILPFEIKKDEAWGVTDEVTGENPDIKKPIFNTTFFRWVAKVVNWFANLFKKNRV